MLPNIKDMENGVFLIAITIHSTDISIWDISAKAIIAATVEIFLK